MKKDPNSKNTNFKDPYLNSQGLKKLWNYYLNLIETDKFQFEIKKIRDKYKISINKNQSYSDFPKSFSEDMEKLSSDYGLAYSTWWTSLEPYVLKNMIIMPRDTDICILSDNINDLDLSRSDMFHYPISIRVSLYASKRDIIDYVERIFPFILHTQKSYRDSKIKIGKFKNRKDSIKERNDFIYKNRNLPRKEIMSLVTDKFGSDRSIDYAYIGKIISLESKKRKEA